MARKLERAELRPFLDRVSKGLAGKRVEIKVASLDLGDQLHAGWVSLIGLVSDPKDDIVEIAIET
jgi:hypothetical protein